MSQFVADRATVAAVSDPNATAAADKDARMWAMICHLSSLAGCVIPIPGVNVIAPLVVWQMKRKESAFIDAHGKEAVNFQITLLIPILIALPLVLIVIGIPLLLAIGVAALVLTIIAALKANNGETYRYPATLRLIK